MRSDAADPSELLEQESLPRQRDRDSLPGDESPFPRVLRVGEAHCETVDRPEIERASGVGEGPVGEADFSEEMVHLLPLESLEPPALFVDAVREVPPLDRLEVELARFGFGSGGPGGERPSSHLRISVHRALGPPPNGLLGRFSRYPFTHDLHVPEPGPVPDL